MLNHPQFPEAMIKPIPSNVTQQHKRGFCILLIGSQLSNKPHPIIASCNLKLMYFFLILCYSEGSPSTKKKTTERQVKNQDNKKTRYEQDMTTKEISPPCKAKPRI